jgi:hypothetical protein
MCTAHQFCLTPKMIIYVDDVPQMQTSPKLDISCEALACSKMALEGADLKVGSSVSRLSACPLKSLSYKPFDADGFKVTLPCAKSFDEVLTQSVYVR